jgi:hypothetical protein
MSLRVDARGRRKVRRPSMPWLDDHDRGSLERRNLQTPALFRVGPFAGITSRTIENQSSGQPIDSYVTSVTLDQMNVPLQTNYEWTAAPYPGGANDISTVANTVTDSGSSGPGAPALDLSVDLTNDDYVTQSSYGGKTLEHTSAAWTGDVNGPAALSWIVGDSTTGKPWTGSLLAQGNLKIVWSPPTGSPTTGFTINFRFNATINGITEVEADNGSTGGQNLNYTFTSQKNGVVYTSTGTIYGFFNTTGNSVLFTYSIPMTGVAGPVQTLFYDASLTTSYNTGAKPSSSATDLQFQFHTNLT